MGERKYTLFEFHSHGSGPSFFSDFGFATQDEEPEESEEIDGEPEKEEESGRGKGILIALILLVAVAATVKYFMSDDESSTPPFESEEVQVTEYEE